MSMDVIIPWGGELDDPWRTGAFWWLRRRYRALLPDATVIVGTSAQDPFNRSEARNNAFRASNADVLVVADADTIFQPDAIREAIRLIENGAPWVIPYRLVAGYYSLSQSASKRILELDPASPVPEPVDDDDWEHKHASPSDPLPSWAGVLVLSRDAWLAAGGYDEGFIGWGYEDVAFRSALDRVVGPHTRVDDSFVLHLWHERSEAENFGQPHIKENQERCRWYEAGGAVHR